jgi:hypothetical protein
MTYTFFTNSDSEEEDTKYSSFVELEEFEEDDEEEPHGFVRVQTGSNIGPDPEGPGIWESSGEAPKPWDPSESFFAYL